MTQEKIQFIVSVDARFVSEHERIYIFETWFTDRILAKSSPTEITHKHMVSFDIPAVYLHVSISKQNNSWRQAR